MTNSSEVRKSNSRWNASAYKKDLAIDPQATVLPCGTWRSHNTCSTASEVLVLSRLSSSSFTMFNGRLEVISKIRGLFQGWPKYVLIREGSGNNDRGVITTAFRRVNF